MHTCTVESKHFPVSNDIQCKVMIHRSSSLYCSSTTAILPYEVKTHCCFCGLAIKQLVLLVSMQMSSYLCVCIISICYQIYIKLWLKHIPVFSDYTYATVILSNTVKSVSYDVNIQPPSCTYVHTVEVKTHSCLQ